MKNHRLLWFLVRKLVTLYYKKEHFWAMGWKVDDTTNIQIISEEETAKYHRKGIKKVKKCSRYSKESLTLAEDLGIKVD